MNVSTPVPVFTWSWRAACTAAKDGRLTVQPVRISLGKPKFWPRAERFPFVAELAPDGWMMRLDSDEKFERVYRAKLDRIGVESIRRRLEEVAIDTHGIALCCFEEAADDCHRTMFARWWVEQTGEELAELEPAQLTTNRRRPLMAHDDDSLREQIDSAAVGPFEVPTCGIDGPSPTLLVSAGDNGVRIAFGDALADLDRQGAETLIATLRRVLEGGR
jgi:hypothetical protein